MNIWEAIQAAKAGKHVICMGRGAYWGDCNNRVHPGSSCSAGLRWSSDATHVEMVEKHTDGWVLVEPEKAVSPFKCARCGRSIDGDNAPLCSKCWKTCYEQPEKAAVPTLTVGGVTFEVWPIRRLTFTELCVCQPNGSAVDVHAFERGNHFGGGYIFGDLGRDLTRYDVYPSSSAWQSKYSDTSLYAAPVNDTDHLVFAAGVLARRVKGD